MVKNKNIINIGDVLFIRGHSPISSLVRLFDNGEFSHICISLTPNGTHVLESQRFVNTRIYPNYYTDYEVVKLNLSESEKSKLVHLAIQMTGIQYDYIQLLEYIFRDFGWKNFRLNNPNKMICSELVSVVLYSLGRLPNESWIYDLTPNELFKYLKKSS